MATASSASEPSKLSGGRPFALRNRLLQDLAELQSQPYPNIKVHVRDEDYSEACLILDVEGYGQMHLTVEFPARYPLEPPKIRMNSDVSHPNIFGSYICASILNTTEGYTPAYTLKGIAIQLLSFFGSDHIEQVGGGGSIGLQSFKQLQRETDDIFRCEECGFGRSKFMMKDAITVYDGADPDEDTAMDTTEDATEVAKEKAVGPIQNSGLPDEILLLICEKLETEDLMRFAQGWQRIGSVMTKFDIIRTRELQCFCFKKDYMVTKLGVGVSLSHMRLGFFESEFDLLSLEGFKTYGINRSVQGVYFEHWLPLPISHGHWRSVKQDAFQSLTGLATEARLASVAPINVIYHFMNDVVVKLNKKTEEATARSHFYSFAEAAKSTLTHASEKAIESYFHLFHLLLCMATEQPSIVQSANSKIAKFMSGETSKEFCPNLGHLLVATLISDYDLSPPVIRAIIKETIIRNAVWVLDKKGANMPELAYMEKSEVSQYRLMKTFEASKTSYRLLMFLNLFRKTAVGNPRKPLNQLCEEAFDRHGAPPRGSAKHLAESIKRIHAVTTFSEFLSCMGLERPSAAWFTSFLRTCMGESTKAGYSQMPVNQAQALYLRLKKEPGVAVDPGLYPMSVNIESRSFFPGKGYGATRGGRGGGRGRGR
ncbi:hypothetical protein BGZ60DRAFT_389069 [Tricladium varicosporioides]|nr:hypothetical protein BGZ60DRAFT_389069 [Hymenoscyphus varicosporioides]